VVTGPGFANFANESFTYPPTTGISYSFTTDGFYEIARYRFVSNASDPQCITGVMNVAHGTVQVLPNSSLVLTPFGDGYQQIQDACAPVSNFLEFYNDTELYQAWEVYNDIDSTGNTFTYLQLFQFDNSPLAPQKLISQTPNMNPTQTLRNVTPAPTLNAQNLIATSATRRTMGIAGASTMLAAGLAGITALSYLL